MARGGDVAIIGARSPLQVVDARDLGSFIVRCAETSAVGSFDGVGPWAPVEEFLAEITPAGVEARLIDISAEAMATAESSLPLLAGTSLPLLTGEPEAVAFMSRPGDRARANGLRTRPLAETAEATREWDSARGSPPLKVGPSPEAEERILSRWVIT